MRRGNAITALEVKSGQRYPAREGLTAFKKHYPRCKTLIVGLSGMDLKEFFETPAAKLV